MKVPLSLLSVAVALLCAACAFGQTVAYQFKAGDFTATTDSATWAAAGGGSVMTSVHSATNGWSLAVKEGGAVCFDNGVSSPLGFPDSATNTVAYAFAVVECSEPSNHATLIDAPCSIRFIPSLFDDSATRFYERQINHAVALSIKRHGNQRLYGGDTATTGRGGVRFALRIEWHLRRRGTRHRRLGAELARGRRRADSACRHAH